MVERNEPNSMPDAEGRPVSERPLRAHTVFSRGARFGGHFFWYCLGILLDQGLTHLLLFPQGMRLMGADLFGKFQFALGIVNNVGLAPSRSLNNTILRSFAGLTDERRALLLRTGFTLMAWVVGVAAVIGIGACLVGRATGRAGPVVSLWVALLIVALAARNIVTLGMVDLGPRRQFARRTFWLDVGSVAALVALPLIYLIGEWCMPVGFMFGHVAAAGLLLTLRRRTFLGRPRLDRTIVRSIVPTWLVLFASTFFFLSSRYVHRTVLGWFQSDSFDAVSAFFAAASALDLLMMPLSVVGLFGYQILSAYASRERFTMRLLRLYGVAALLGCACFYIVGRLVAPWVVQRLYPDVAEQALPLLDFILPGMALTVLMHTSRPFVMKFSPRRALLSIGVVSFVAHVGAALTLIPARGLVGAAWAYGIGSAVVGLTWFGFFAVGFLLPGNGVDARAPADNIDPE